MDKTTEKDLNEIFNIPEHERENDEANGSFEDKLKDVAETIAVIDAQKVKSLSEIMQKPVKDETLNTVIEVPPTESPPIDPDILKHLSPEIPGFPGDLLGPTIPHAGPSIDFPKSIVSEVPKMDITSDVTVPQVVENIPQLPEIPGQWILKSPSSKFNRFYSEKARLIRQILVDGIIPFAKYTNELRDSSVDISISIFDTREIYDKMRQVQGYKDRIKQIQIHCNSQLFLWERGIELLHGVLAKAEYDKPAVKYDGIIYEHMVDMETYFARLRGLVRSTDAVMKTLEGAHECLSRRVTIALPMKPLERYEKPVVSHQDYDSLPVSDTPIKAEQISLKQSKGTHSVSWDEI